MLVTSYKYLPVSGSPLRPLRCAKGIHQHALGGDNALSLVGCSNRPQLGGLAPKRMILPEGTGATAMLLGFSERLGLG